MSFIKDMYGEENGSNVLQQSFGNVSADCQNEEDDKVFKNSNFKNSGKFQRSQFDSQTFQHAENQSQEQLKMIQKITNLRVQMNLQTFATIFTNKLLGPLGYGFDFLKNYEISKIKPEKIHFSNINEQASALTKNDRDLFINVTNMFIKKLSLVLQLKQVKLLGLGFSQIVLNAQIQKLNGVKQRTKSIEKSQSIVHPYRGSIKFENLSQKNDSEWDLGLSQGGLQQSQNAARQNKFLKKKKQNLNNKRQNFIGMMNQLLQSHQAFLGDSK